LSGPLFARVSVYTTVSPTLAVETLDVFEIERSGAGGKPFTTTVTVEVLFPGVGSVWFAVVVAVFGIVCP